MNTGETIALIKALGGGGSSLPPVTSSDNGKVLGVVDGAWAASEQGKKFIVTLTPTAQDFSGTMDKTVAEINAAYEAGMEIWFEISDGSYQTFTFPMGSVVNDTRFSYPCFHARFVYDVYDIFIYTGSDSGGTDTGTETAFSTRLYALTPAS